MRTKTLGGRRRGIARPHRRPSCALNARDHFSGHAADYARYRPDYPDALFAWLASQAPARRRAWDCATGSGQAAMRLAEHFEEVVATDASARQIEEARPHARVTYSVAPAERSGLESGSVDLVTVAQALHWFDLERFWAEATRVCAPGAVVAVWCYDLLRVAPEIDAVLVHLYRDVVGPYWPPERAIVEHGYGSLSFPFDEIRAPSFAMEKLWTLPELVGYVRTWSATRRYMAENGMDPLADVEIEGTLRSAWGDPERQRTAMWDLDLRVGKVPRASGRPAD